MGYAPLKMKEQQHPTADELDEISKDRPVLVVHSSGHGGSMNHALMKLLSVDAKTANPQGGEYIREKGSDMPSGPMEETALIDLRNKRPSFTREDAARVITGAAKIWACNGQTTAMECGLGADDISIVENAIDQELLPIDPAFPLSPKTRFLRAVPRLMTSPCSNPGPTGSRKCPQNR